MDFVAAAIRAACIACFVTLYVLVCGWDGDVSGVHREKAIFTPKDIFLLLLAATLTLVVTGSGKLSLEKYFGFT